MRLLEASTPRAHVLLAMLLVGLLCGQAAAVTAAQGAASAPTGSVNVLAGDNALTLTATSAAWRHRVLLLVDPPADPAALRLEAGTLRGPGDAEVPLTLQARGQQGNPITIAEPGGGTVPLELELSARLPRPGEYNGHITWRLGEGAAVTRPLKLSFAVPRLPVVVRSTLRGESGLWAWRSATLAVNLGGADDEVLNVTPTVADLALVRPGRESVQSGATVAIELPASAAGPAVAVGRNQAPTLLLKMDTFAQPGEHKGKLLLSAPDHAASEATFSVVVRDPPWLALLLIAAGSIASLLLRRQVGEARQRLQLRAEAARVREHLQRLLAEGDGAQPQESELLQYQTGVVDRLDAELDGSGAIPAAQVTVFEARIEHLRTKATAFVDWVAARRLMVAVPASVPKEKLDPIRKKLSDVAAALRGDGEFPTARRDDLQALPGEIQGLLSEHWRGLFAALSEDCGKRRDAVVGEATAALWLAPVATLKAGEASLGLQDFGAARQAYERARGEYAQALMGDLRARLQLTPPAGVTQWAELQQQVQAVLARAGGAASDDADALWRIYGEAWNLYFDAVMAPFAAYVGNTAELERHLANVDETHRVPLRKAAAEAVAQLAEAATRRARGDLAGAWQVFREAFNQWQSLLLMHGVISTAQRLGGAGEAARGAMAAIAGAPPPPAAPGQALGAPRLSALPARPSAAALDARRRTLDAWADAVAVAVAVLLGLNFVWAANPVWGGPVDWVLTLLWGLGVHQVSGYTFEGVMGLRNKLVP
jgi:hypothetical protein